MILPCPCDLELPGFPVICTMLQQISMENILLSSNSLSCSFLLLFAIGLRQTKRLCVEFRSFRIPMEGFTLFVLINLTNVDLSSLYRLVYYGRFMSTQCCVPHTFFFSIHELHDVVLDLFHNIADESDLT